MPVRRAASPGGHPIQVAARKTGLTPEVLRVWEKRYRVVSPGRRANGRRLYSDEDIEKLRLIRRALAGGRRIGDVSHLSPAALEALIHEDDREASVPRPEGSGLRASPDVAAIRERCLDAVLDLDGPALDAALRAALLALNGQEFVDDVVAPLLREIGERWSMGSLAPYQEHMATFIVQGVLVDGLLPPPPGAPTLVVATPAGQRHALGAMLVAVTAALANWKVVYLGADLPAGDIAGAVAQSRAAALALSIVHPADDPRLPGELRDLVRGLPPGTTVLAGGRAVSAYAPGLTRLGALVLPDTRGLRDTLQGLNPARG